MADRVGTRGGVVRPNRTGMVGVGGSIGVPSAGNGAARTWGILARNTEALAEQSHQIYDRQVAVQSSEQGTMDAINGRVRRLDRSTTRGGAYMDAALETSTTIANTNALVAMNEFFIENPNDPAALEDAFQNYADGAAGEMMAVDPAAAVQLRARILTHALPMINSAVANREQETARLKKEAQATAEAELNVAVTRSAPDLYSPDKEQRRAASTAMFDAVGTIQSLQSESAVDGYLLSRLTAGHDAAHIVNMQPQLKTRLAAMIEGAPENLRNEIQIFSGYRSPQRQSVLFDAAVKKYGSVAAARKHVAPPGRSQHNHGFASDMDFGSDAARDWVHEHAADYGLKFPMDYEPWHIEVQETRGGKPFEGRATISGTPDQQAINDAVNVPAFKSWFTQQTNKPQAYLDFVAGKIELPMTLPDGRDVTVNVRRSLSDKAAESLMQDLRTQISFETGLRKDAEEASAKEQKERSDETVAGFMTGILANGVESTLADGRKVRAQKPTEGDLLDALERGDLEPGDYVDLLKAVRSPPAATSDPEVERGIFSMIARGEDPSEVIMQNLPHLTADDAKKWTDYFGARENADGSLNSSQKFYLDQIEAGFRQGMTDPFDSNKQERMVASQIEARERMLAGEKPEDVYNDIVKRAKFATMTSQMGDALSMTPAIPRPRFSVPDPLNPSFIDPAATALAINDAFQKGTINKPQYDQALASFREFVQWQEGRKAQEKEGAAQ